MPVSNSIFVFKILEKVVSKHLEESLIISNNELMVILCLITLNRNYSTGSTERYTFIGKSISGPSISGLLTYGGVVWVLVVDFQLYLIRLIMFFFYHVRLRNKYGIHD